MRKMMCIITAICVVASLTACGGKTQEKAAASDVFTPSLDTNTGCAP